MKIGLAILTVFFIQIIQSKITEITYEFPYDMTVSDVNGWTHSNSTISRLVNCGGYPRFGEFGSTVQNQRGNSWAYKNYNSLPPHYSLAVQFQLIEIRSLDSEFFSVLIDSNKVWYGNSYNFGWSNSARYCTGGAGQSWAKSTRYKTISVNTTHTSSNLKLELQSEVDSGAYDESWAISDLFISVDECHETCKTCSGPSQYDCTSCPNGAYSYGSGACLCDGLTYASNHECVSSCPAQQSKNNTNMSCYNTCSDNCSSCSSTDQCTSCNSGYYLLNGYCVNHCPFYTTLSGNTCIDNDYDNSQSPQILIQDFTDIQFSSSQLQENGWYPGIWETNTQAGIERPYTSLSGEKCNGLQLGLGHTFNQLYNCTPSCQLENQFDNLPYHWGYNLKAQLWLGDNWTGESIDIKVDDQVIKTQSHTYVPGTRDFDCGINYNQASSNYIYDIELLSQPHQSSNLKLTFEWTMNKISLQAWVGIRDVQITLLKCNEKCSECDNGNTCTKCNPTRQNPPNCDEPAPGYFDDGSNSVNFRMCSYQCGECTGTADNCTKCRYYNDNLRIPDCTKPDNCLNYAKADSLGYNQRHLKGSNEYILDDVVKASSSDRGIHVVQFDSDAQFIEIKTYDTHGDIEACKSLISYVDAIPLFNIVMLGVFDASTNYLQENCIYSLEKIGWNRSIGVAGRDSYTVISRKKENFQNVDEEDYVKSSITTYHAHVEKCVIECDFQCAECSGTPTNCTKCRFFTASAPPSCSLPEQCLTFVDIQSRGEDAGSFFQATINGVLPDGYTNSRGINVVEIDENGQVYNQYSYDTHISEQAVLDFVTFIDTVQDDKYVLVGVRDEGSKSLNKQITGYDALQSLGFTPDIELMFRDGFAMVGKKQKDSANINQKLSRRFDDSYSHIQQCIKNCDIKCASCSTSSDNCDSCSSNLRDGSCNLPTNCGKFIYLKSIGFFYDKWNADANQIAIYINDINVTFSQQNGVHLLVIDNKGQTESTQSFDYSQDSSQLTAMINFINSIDNGKKVLVVSKDDMFQNMTPTGYTALQSLGLSNSVTVQLREAFVMMGEKGSAQGTASYQIGDAKPGAVVLQDCALGCEYQCGTCQMETYTCLSCSDSTRTSTPDCDCKDGTYDIGIPKCSDCDYKCATCETNQNNCLTCSDTNRDINDSCKCKDSWYNDGTNPTCQKCPNKYAKCTSETDGTLCQGNNRSTITPACDCNDGYYDDNTNSEDCVKCDATCTKCSSDTVCSECADGYYLSGTSCLQCPNKFTKCTSATVGTECNTGLGRTTATPPSCECDSGFFDNNTNSNDCVQCDHPCDNCQNSATECTTCHAADNRFDIPNCHCKTGYYETNLLTCEICVYPCSECENNSNECTQCINTQNRNGIPTCDCIAGHFTNDSKICEICQYPCKECSGSASTCTECVADVNRLDNENCRCKDGTYDDGTQCQSCNLVKCQTCENQADECIICADTTRGGNQCLCRDGYFEKGTPQCGQCDYQCSKCQNQSNQCLECSDLENRDLNNDCKCKDTFYDDGQNKDCIKCKYPCLNCLSDNICLTCQGLERISSNCHCRQGFYENDGKPDCEQCDIQCGACQNTNQECIICKYGKFRDMVPPVCGCQDGYYQIDDQLDCQLCSHNCKKCQDNTGICTECSNDNFAPPNCVESYQSTYLETITDNSNLPIQVEKNCSHQCQTCSQSSQNCTLCTIGLNRVKQTPDCGCLQGYHDNNFTTDDCYKCSINCLTCNSYEHCLSCDYKKNRSLNPINLQCECIQGFKESSQDSSICVPCYSYAGACFETCPQNTIVDFQLKVCNDIKYKAISNTVLIFICFSVLLVVQIALCLGFKTLSKKKLSKLGNNKPYKIQNNNNSSSGEENKIENQL